MRSIYAIQVSSHLLGPCPNKRRINDHDRLPHLFAKRLLKGEKDQTSGGFTAPVTERWQENGNALLTRGKFRPRGRSDHPERFSGVTFPRELNAILTLQRPTNHDDRLPHISTKRLLKRQEGSGRSRGHCTGNSPITGKRYFSLDIDNRFCYLFFLLRGKTGLT